jgi:hypothetical protein
VVACAVGARGQTGAPFDLSSLTLVPSNAIPVFGNFYLVENYGVTRLPGWNAFGPPLPGDPRPDLPVYSAGNGIFIIDNSNDPQSNEPQAAMARGGMMMDSGGMTPMFTFPTDGLWLQMNGVTNGTAYLDLNNATNQVYEILTKTDLSQPTWTIENEVWPTNQTAMPFTISENGRTNLFVWAMDWTGVTENGNTTPDWWFWEYFGTTALTDNTLDFRGFTLSSDYQNGLDPNLVNFGLSVTNQFVRTAQTTATLSVSQGQPFNEAVLIDDTNLSDAVWTPYAGPSVTVNFAGQQGWHSVWIGLTGDASNSVPAWQSIRLKYDPTPPVLTITNPVPGTVTQPMIEVQGYSSKLLTAISYDLSNAAGSVSNQQVLVLDQTYDTNAFEYTTSTFQAFDVPVTNGLNTITLHATDLAGNTTTASYNYTLDYSTKTNPLLVKLYWPQNQTVICISNYTWRGWVGDFTASVVAQSVDTNGDTNIYLGEVGRDGNFWVENMVLANGTNYLTLTVTDAAGNVTTTNITVDSGSLSLNINDPTPDQLWSNAIPVTGTISDSSDYTVWVNGVKATLNGNGTWSANNVYLPTGGTAVLQARAIPNSDNNGNGTGGTGGGPVTYANLGNPSSPSALDADVQIDKPVRLYVSSYTLNETGTFDQSDYYTDADGEPVIPYGLTSPWYHDVATAATTGSWQDGAAGSANYTYHDVYSSIYGTGTNDQWDNVVYQQTLYPDVEVASFDRSEDEYGNPMPLFWESCNISTPLTDHTGAALIQPEYFDGVNYDLQTIKETENRHAQAVIKLFTGGKGIPGNHNLFSLTATATSGTFCKDPPPGGLINLSCAPTPPIPPTSIMMGELGYLGSDGNLFVALPDNVTKTVTPTVSGSQYYTFSASAVKHKLRVYANGEPLSDTQVHIYANYSVGQYMTFSPIFTPPISSVQSTVFLWAFTGHYVNADIETIGSVNYFIANTVLQLENTYAWWVSGGTNTPATYSATIGENIAFNNGQNVVVTGRGTFHMYRPSLGPLSVPPPPAAVTLWSGGAGLTMLGLNGSSATAMGFGTAVNSHFSGTAAWTQLINGSAGGFASYYDTDGSNELDTLEYYDLPDPPLPFVSVSPGISAYLPLTDAPFIACGPSPTAIAITFQDFALFKPDAGNPLQNIFVPLGIVTWGVNATAYNTPSGWVLSSTSSVTPPTLTSTETFPQWILTLSP